MNKTVLLILAGMVALLTESCSYISDFADARKELEDNGVKPNPVKVKTAKIQTQEQEEEEFADLEEESQPVQEIAGLIPATNPDVRVRSSVRGRQDPFSIITLKPSIKIEQKGIKQGSNDGTGSQISEPGAEVFRPTLLAQKVVITGVYEANGRTKLIVQAPEENTSRYVEVGQYLSNGQILVKSIDMSHFPTPLVILEQSGIEVVKAVGQTPEDSKGDKISSLPLQSSGNDETYISNVSLNLQ